MKAICLQLYLNILGTWHLANIVNPHLLLFKLISRTAKMGRQMDRLEVYKLYKYEKDSLCSKFTAEFSHQPKYEVRDNKDCNDLL